MSDTDTGLKWKRFSTLRTLGNHQQCEDDMMFKINKLVQTQYKKKM